MSLQMFENDTIIITNDDCQRAKQVQALRQQYWASLHQQQQMHFKQPVKSSDQQLSTNEPSCKQSDTFEVAFQQRVGLIRHQQEAYVQQPGQAFSHQTGIQQQAHATTTQLTSNTAGHSCGVQHDNAPAITIRSSSVDSTNSSCSHQSCSCCCSKSNSNSSASISNLSSPIDSRKRSLSPARLTTTNHALALTEQSAPAYSFAKASRWPHQSNNLKEQYKRLTAITDNTQDASQHTDSAIRSGQYPLRSCQDCHTSNADDVYALARQVLRLAPGESSTDIDPEAAEAYAAARQVLGLPISCCIQQQQTEQHRDTAKKSTQGKASTTFGTAARFRDDDHSLKQRSQQAVTSHQQHHQQQKQHTSNVSSCRSTAVPAVAASEGPNGQCNILDTTDIAAAQAPPQPARTAPGDIRTTLNLVKPKAAAFSFSHASVKRQIQQLLEERKRQKAAAATAEVSVREATTAPAELNSVRQHSTKHAAMHAEAYTEQAEQQLQCRAEPLSVARPQNEKVDQGEPTPVVDLGAYCNSSARGGGSASRQAATIHSDLLSSKGTAPDHSVTDHDTVGNSCIRSNTRNKTTPLRYSRFPVLSANSATADNCLLGPGSYNVTDSGLDALSYRQRSSRTSAVFGTPPRQRSSNRAGRGRQQLQKSMQQLSSDYADDARSATSAVVTCYNSVCNSVSNGRQWQGVHATPTPRQSRCQYSTGTTFAGSCQNIQGLSKRMQSPVSDKDRTVPWKVLFGSNDDYNNSSSNSASIRSISAPPARQGSTTAAVDSVLPNARSSVVLQDGELTWLTAEVQTAANVTKPRIKSAVIMPLPAAAVKAQKAGTAAATAEADVAKKDAATLHAIKPIRQRVVQQQQQLQQQTQLVQVGSGGRCEKRDEAEPAIAATILHAALQQERQVPTAAEASAAAADEMYVVDVKFTLVEPRVKGGPVMVRSCSNPRSSSRNSITLDTRSRSSSTAAHTECSNSGNVQGSTDADAWALDAAVRARKPAWQFPTAAAAARSSFAAGGAAAGSSVSHQWLDQQLVELQPDYSLVKPRVGTGVLWFSGSSSSGSSSAIGDGRSGLRELLLAARNKSGRQPGPCSYELSTAWSYLQKHIPSVLLQAAATHVATAAAATAVTGNPDHSDSDDSKRHAVTDQAVEQAVWYDLSRALQHVRPRVPAWGFAPLPALGFKQASPPGFKQPGYGALSGLEMFYDVQVTLVKKRTPGAVPFQLQLPRCEAVQSSTTIHTTLQQNLGPGYYDPNYNLVQPTLAKLLLPFQAGSTAAADAGIPAEGDVLDLDVTSALQAVLPSKATNATVRMTLMLGRDDAMAAAAAGSCVQGLGFGRLTHHLPLPDADLDAAVRMRVPEVTLFASSAPAHQGQIDVAADQAAANRGPGTYEPLLAQDTFAALAVKKAAAAAIQNSDAANMTAVNWLPGPDFERATNRQGYVPNSATAAAAAIAARRLAAVGADGDKLDLNPDVTVTKRSPPGALIMPEALHNPAVRDPGGYAAWQQQQMGVWKDRLCSAADDAVKPRPQGFRGAVGFDQMIGRSDEAGTAENRARHLKLQHGDLDYRVEDIPLSVLASYRSAPKPPAFDTMLARGAAGTAAGVAFPGQEPQQGPVPGDLLAIDAMSAADAIRSRAIAGSVANPSCGVGLVNIGRQIGRDDLCGSAAGTNVMSAADLEASSWIDYYINLNKPDCRKPCTFKVIGFEQQLSRSAVYANAAAAPSAMVGLETGDVDAGVYNPKPAAAVWPAAAAAGFTTAARSAAEDALCERPMAATARITVEATAATANNAGVERCRVASVQASGRCLPTLNPSAEAASKCCPHLSILLGAAVTTQESTGTAVQELGALCKQPVSNKALYIEEVCDQKSSSCVMKPRIGGAAADPTVKALAAAAKLKQAFAAAGSQHKPGALLIGMQPVAAKNQLAERREQLRRSKLELLKQNNRQPNQRQHCQ